MYNKISWKWKCSFITSRLYFRHFYYGSAK